MPDQSELFDVSKKHLIGKLVTATVPKGMITDISMPGENQFRHMLVLSAADFGEHTGMSVMDDEYPFFAREEVLYKGQPVLAVFGYESEDVDLFCKEVKVSYQITPDSEEIKAQSYGSPFIWSSGNVDEYFTPKFTTFKSSFEVTPFSDTMLGDQKVFAVKKEDRFHVRVASQWPIHVRKSVSETLGCDIGNVLVYPQQYYAPYDQLIVMPSVLACIASMAAEISGELVQLSAPMISWQPHMVLEHETAMLQDGTIVADRASCTVDLGAFPIFTAEVCDNILAGLISVYPLRAAEVSIFITRSSTPPANFFGDLGFSMALAGTERHYSQLAQAQGIQPGIWRYDQVKDLSKNGFPVLESVKQNSDLNKLGDSVKRILDKSWYSRKYSANTQKKMFSMKTNPLINYSRGIGIACGEGIMGFSQHFNAKMNYKLSITMNEDQSLTVNTGMMGDKSMVGIWKETIRRCMEVDADDISFLSVNDPEILDMGPSTLSRKMGIVSSLLIKACADLERKRSFSRLPVTVTAEYEAELTDPFYFSSSLGTVAIDLHIDTVMLSPIIDNIWVNFHLGHIFDMDKLLNKARHTITTVLSDICPRSSAKCNIDIVIEQDGSFMSSLTSGLRGLTTAALISALSQALGHQIRRIPVTSDDILAIAALNTYGDSKGSTAGADK